jgi:hypothetical protein
MILVKAYCAINREAQEKLEVMSRQGAEWGDGKCERSDCCRS